MTFLCYKAFCTSTASDKCYYLDIREENNRKLSAKDFEGFKKSIQKQCL